MSRSPSEMLAHAAGPPKKVVEAPAAISELERILALPRRKPFDCQRDPQSKRYAPATQALIEVVTERFSRGRRSTCACRPRKLRLESDGSLLIARVLPDGAIPEPPTRVTISAFVAANRSSEAELDVADRVSKMRVGDELDLPAADGIAGHPCIEMLNAVQSWILWEAEQVGGVVAFAGVGSGKTYAWLLAPLLFPDARVAALVIEPKQRHHFHSHYLRLREHFRVPTIVFDHRPGYTVAGTTPLHVISYSILSRTSSSDLLDSLKPEALILDEAHRACGNSAINRRVKRYCAAAIKLREEKIKRGEPVRLRAVNLLDGSGTLEAKSVEDTQMLCVYSLGTGSPLPVDKDEATKWSAVVDVSYRPDRESKTAHELQRVFGDGKWDKEVALDDLFVAPPEESIRKGICQRRIETLGVISASAAAINASIYFSERAAPKMPKAVQEALENVRQKYERPDGVILNEKMEQIAAAKSVACGYYNYWAFPKHPCTCPPPDRLPRCKQCILIDDWFAKRKLFSKELRVKLIAGEAHLDSPKLCEEAAERWATGYKGPLPVWRAEHWPAWRDIRDKVEYDERERWIGQATSTTPAVLDEQGHVVGEFLVRDAAKWALKNKGVVWFQSIAFGRKLEELTKLPYFNGGTNAEPRMMAEKGDRSILCSIKAHGASTDGLQRIFHKQLICETPASNATQQGYEQLLGRLHREGQNADVVETEGYFHVSEMKDALRKAIAQAEFNFTMTTNKQKILCCDMEIDL